MGGLGLLMRRRAIQAHPTAGSDYIKFADEAVFNVLMAKGVSSDGVGITKDDALKVTSIASWFRNNADITKFEELQYFRNVIDLEDRAFSQCVNLTKIDLRWVETMGGSVFEYCPLSYENFETPHLKVLGANAFPNAYIRHYTNMGNIAQLPTEQFPTYGRRDTLQSINIPFGVKVLPTQAFFNYAVLTNINTSHIEDFGASCLRKTALTSVDFSSAKHIREAAFYDTPLDMEYFDAPNLESFSTNAFRDAKIKHFRNFGKITNIPRGGGSYSNYGVKSYTESITFPQSVETIQTYVLYGYTALKSVTFLSVVPPTISDSVTWDNTGSCPIYVPDASVEAYKTATNWTKVADRIRPLSEYQG